MTHGRKLEQAEPWSEPGAGEDPDGYSSAFRLRAVRAAGSSSTAPPAPSPRSNRPGWTVVDEFERDGFRYQVVRRPVRSDEAPRLTRREQQALAYASQGHSNKSIAYALGVAASTVGVLLYRAAGKLGAKSRHELLLAYERSQKDPSGLP
jgi:DNA-binding CsgD family transcriptional regulator